jgi:HrpA-like RNA helicase
VLVFLPGVVEIRAVARLLAQEQALRSAGVVVQQLHGGLSPQQQDEVIRWVLVCVVGGTERGNRVCFASASAVRFWHGRMCVCVGGGCMGGCVLVFLPGVGELRTTARLLAQPRV